MPSIYELVFWLLLILVLPICLLSYGSYVIYLHRVRKGRLKLHRIYAYSLLTTFIFMWIIAALQSTDVLVAEVVNPSNRGSVVQLYTPGFLDHDIDLYVRDYEASGNKLVDLKVDTSGVDGREIPPLYWSHDKSLLIIDYHYQDDKVYDFINHRMLDAASMKRVVKIRDSQRISINWPDGHALRQWQIWFADAI